MKYEIPKLLSFNDDLAKLACLGGSLPTGGIGCTTGPSLNGTTQCKNGYGTIYTCKNGYAATPVNKGCDKGVLPGIMSLGACIEGQHATQARCKTGTDA